MKWRKAPEALVSLLAERLKDVDCQHRKMFGCPTYFIRGNMFAGVHGVGLFLRLPEPDIGRIRREHSDVALFEPIPGKAMRGYIVLPRSIYADARLFDEVLAKSIKYAASLPPKQKTK